jgi:hypothetical protein
MENYQYLVINKGLLKCHNGPWVVYFFLFITSDFVYKNYERLESWEIGQILGGN